ncbi:unnamed protein product [Lupinus luteus]|uniref:Uncharacterized protein n=1 Tax=Lupinus luteus TaxID=3873 RepID=A0AAV1W793_LUPLU
MEIIGQGVIPLTRIDENLTPREIEQQAAELAYFLRNIGAHKKIHILQIEILPICKTILTSLGTTRINPSS